MTLNVERILKEKFNQNNAERYKPFGLTSNPFPKSGTANINESSKQTVALTPIDDRVHRQILDYISDSMNSRDEEDQKLVASIIGDYGTGKTQLLLYAKSIIQTYNKNAFVLYINNPGTTLTQLLGSIIDSIGYEQFKKFLWNGIVDSIKDEKENYKERLQKFLSDPQGDMFGPKTNPFSQENEVNHKAFLESFLIQINDRKKRLELNETLKSIIQAILMEKYEDAVIADYFYNLIAEDTGVSKTWENITSGTGKFLQNKVVKLLNAIIDIIRNQGFDRFYLLVDEFEDITSGRLTKRESDSYAFNLRALIDKERRWCLLIALTRTALDDLRKISPPLSDRLTDREINIERLSAAQVRRLVLNYLNLSRKEAEDLTPFSSSAIERVNSISGELPRLTLRRLYFLLERAADLKVTEIDEKFVSEQLEDI